MLNELSCTANLILPKLLLKVNLMLKSFVSKPI